jgi:diguanylate cyclase (GGDEF)-like protein
MYAALERSQERLNHQATHDALTGLMNRAELMRTMAHLLRVRPPTATAAVLFVDLDSFKEVNDAEGHAVGDALLIVLAARLQGAVRPGDIVARFGGDEFVVVLARATEDEAIVVAERIIERCSEPVVAHDVRTRVGASVGITVLHGSADADAVLRSADAAMYDAKRSGRSRYALRRIAA